MKPLVQAVALALTLTIAPWVDAQSYTLSMNSADGFPGGTVAIPVMLDSSAGADVNGWSWGVCYDPADIDTLQVDPGSSITELNGGAGPDFYDSFLEPAGWATAALASFLTLETLPPAADHELAVATYAPLVVGSIPLTFCDTLGVPPVAIQIVSDGDQFTATVVNATVESAPVDFFTYIAADVTAGYDEVTGLGTACADLSIDDPLDTAEDTQGFSMGIAQVPDSILFFDSAEPTGVLAAANGGAGPDFFAVSAYSNGWTVGAVYSLTDMNPIAFTQTEPVITVCYTTAGSLAGDPDGDVVQLEWIDTLGSPPVVNEVLADGTVFAPGKENGSITLVPSTGSPFVRGDCNGDTNQDIADAVTILEVLFVAGVDASCTEACNANGDASLDLADAIWLLNYLVGSGAAPPAPFPACGGDGGLDCAYPACL